MKTYAFWIVVMLSFVSKWSCAQELYQKIEPSYKVSEIGIDIADKDLNLRYIAKDSSGYVWMTSRKGLIVSNKSTALQYRNGSQRLAIFSDSLSSYFTSLKSDDDSHLIFRILDQDMVVRYNPYTREVMDYFEIEDKIPSSFLYAGKSTEGNLAYLYGDGTDYPNTLYKLTETNTPQKLFEIPPYEGTQEGMTYFASVRNNYFLLDIDWLYILDSDGTLLQKIKNPDGSGELRTAMHEKDEIYFMNRKPSEILSWDFESQSLKSVIKIPNVMDLPARSFATDGNYLILFNEQQLLVYDIKNKTYQDLMPIFKDYISNGEQVNSSSSFEHILLEENGNFLINTKNDLYQFTYRQNNISFFKETIIGHESQPSMRAITEDDNGHIYACYYVGVAKKEKGANEFKVLNIPDVVSKDRVSSFSLSVSNNQLVWDNQLLDLDSNNTYITSESKSNGHSVHYRNKDTIWTYAWWNDTFSEYIIKENRLKSYPFDVSKYPDTRFEVINDMIPNASGNHFWIGISRIGICLLSKTGNVLEKYTPEDLKMNATSDVFDLRIEGDTLWYGGTMGLGTLNTITKETSTYTFPDTSEKNALTNRQVYFIEPLDKDHFYLGTDYGIILFNKDNESYSELDVNHPLAPLEFNRASHFKSSNGKFYMGTTQGLFSFFPEDLSWKNKSRIAATRIDEIAIFNNEGNNRFFSAGVNELNAIKIKPTDASIEVLYSALKENEDIFYSYRITGLSDNWSSYTSENKINLLGLPAGSFNLEIRNNISPFLIKTLQLNKQEFWHKRWYVQLGFLLTIVIITFSFMRYRYNQRLAKEKELASLRDKISSDLHDDVGSMLTAVAMQSEVLHLKALPEQKKKLARIGGMSREAMSRMRDTVWSIDSQKDTFESLVDRINEFLVDAMHNTHHMQHSFLYLNKLPLNHKMNPVIRQNVYLICKEAITNTLKHSNGDQLKVTLENTKKHIRLLIEDNGVVSQNISTSGLGLSNMKRRAKKINGVLDIETKDGFKITLTANQ